MSRTDAAEVSSHASDDPGKIVTVIKPTKRWILIDLKDVVWYRELLCLLA